MSFADRLLEVLDGDCPIHHDTGSPDTIYQLEYFLVSHAERIEELFRAADGVNTDWNAESARRLREVLETFAVDDD